MEKGRKKQAHPMDPLKIHPGLWWMWMVSAVDVWVAPVVPVPTSMTSCGSEKNDVARHHRGDLQNFWALVPLMAIMTCRYEIH